MTKLVVGENVSFFNSCQATHLLVLGLVEAVSETALATVVPVEVAGHEHAGTTLISRALTTQTVDFAVLVNLWERKKETVDNIKMVN